MATKMSSNVILQLSGINHDRIIDENLPEDYFCCLCHCLFWEPCSCKICIDQYLLIPRYDSRKSVYPSNCRHRIKQCPSELFNALSHIRIHCQYQKVGCLEILRYDLLEEHEKNECDYRFQPYLEQSCLTDCTNKRIKMKEDSINNIESIKDDKLSIISKKLTDVSNGISEHSYKLQTIKLEHEKMRVNLCTIENQLHTNETRHRHDHELYKDKQNHTMNNLADKINENRAEFGILKNTTNNITVQIEDICTRLKTLETSLAKIECHSLCYCQYLRTFLLHPKWIIISVLLIIIFLAVILHVFLIILVSLSLKQDSK